MSQTVDTTASPVEAARQPALGALTGLRFPAAMMVVFFHFSAFFLMQLGAPPWLWRLVGTGYMGVNLFFILSGFILTYTYRGADHGMTTTARSFWWARVARVYPVYLLGLAMAASVVVPTMLLRGDAPAFIVATVAICAALLQNWAGVALVFNGPGWSLCAEAFFYALFPLLLVGLRGRGPRGLGAIAAVCWAASVALPFVYMALDPDMLGPTPPMGKSATWIDHLRFNPLVRLPEFVVGMCVGALYQAHRHLPAPRAAAGWTLALVAAIAVFAQACPLYVPHMLLHNGLLTPAYATLIYLLARAPETPLARALAAPVAQVAGQASYATYILHAPLWALFVTILGPKLVHTAGFFPVYLAALLALSWAVFRGVEDPMRRWLRGRGQ